MALKTSLALTTNDSSRPPLPTMTMITIAMTPPPPMMSTSTMKMRIVRPMLYELASRSKRGLSIG